MEYDYDKLPARAQWDQYGHFHKSVPGMPLILFSTGELIVTASEPGPEYRDHPLDMEYLSGVMFVHTSTSPGTFSLDGEAIPTAQLTQGGGQHAIVDTDTGAVTGLTFPSKTAHNARPHHLKWACAWAHNPEGKLLGGPLEVSRPNKRNQAEWAKAREEASLVAKGLVAVNNTAPWVNNYRGSGVVRTATEYGHKALLDRLLAAIGRDPRGAVVDMLEEATNPSRDPHYSPECRLHVAVLHELAAGTLLGNTRSVIKSNDITYKV